MFFTKLSGRQTYGFAKQSGKVFAVIVTQGVPVIALAGSLGEGYQAVREAGIEACFSLAPGPITLEHACANAGPELEARAADLARFWRLARGARC